MKNNKVLIIGIAIFIIAIAVGYALFSENINISGTASAEGSLQLELTNVQTGGQVGNYQSVNKYISYDIDGTSVTFTANLQQPNDIFQFIANIENHGSVDAKLNSVDANPNFNREDACGLTSSLGEECSMLKNVGYLDESTGAYFLVCLYDNNNMIYNSTDIVIPAGDTSGNYQVMIMVGWQESWNTAITEPQQITFTIDFGFVQDN